MTTTTLTETSMLVEASGSKSGRLAIQIITPGWGSSGYYSAEVLEQAAKDGVFHAGTQCFIDHPTEAEAAERPGRSVKDLAAVLEADAVWNGSALVAPVRTFGPYRDAIVEMKDAIGMSIRSTAEVSEGEAAGRRGLIVERLVEGKSVDFVTAAGRGGKVLEVLESARAAVAHRAVTRGVAEATANDTREALNEALKDEYGAEKTWIWVRDFDDSMVWFEIETEDSTGVYGQAYSLDDNGTATLTGDRTPVRVKTQYVPVDEAALAALQEARNVAQWMESRIHLGFTQVADEMFGNGKLTREERIALSSGIGDALGAFTASVEKAAPQLYTRDLWTDPENQTQTAVEAQATSLAGEPATLPGLETVAESTTSPEGEQPNTDAAPGKTGTATPAAVTADQTPTTSQEETMTETPLGSPRQVIEAQIAAQHRELVEMKAREKARGVIAEDLADSFLSPRQLHRVTEELMVGLPIVNDELDVTALRDRVAAKRDAAEAEAGEVLQAHGAGLPRGLGASSTAPLSEAAAGAVNFEKRATDAFQTLGLSESAAKVAAAGR